MTPSRIRSPLVFFAWCAAISAGLTILFLSKNELSISGIALSFAITLTYSVFIGFPCFFVIPQVLCRIARSAVWARWMAILVLLSIFTALGTLATQGLFTAIGVFERHSFWSHWWSGVRLAMIISLGVGVAISLYEQGRSRLEEAALELKQRELEKERALKLASEAQFAALSSQVHPHFLFNTLNSITALIREDPRRAERTVERLAALLRFSLDAHRAALVPLEQELKIIGDYLEIERARFGDRLTYQLDAPKELLDAQVPPLSVQTLVENSVKYAVAERRQGGNIRVAVRAQRGEVEVEVSDDGPGLPPGPFPAGHGMENLQARLVALFGGNARLRVDRRVTGLGGGDDWTVVSLIVPNQRGSEAA